MTFNKETWFAALKQAVSDLKAKPTAGLPCAIATARVIRDAMLADVSEEDKPIIIDFFNGKDGFIHAIVKAERDGNLAGFACNASAAAKAAKLTTSEEVVIDVSE